MSDEASIAFAPLVERAIQSSSATNPPDRISVRDHVVAVEIGAFQAERDTTQRLRFSVVVEVATSNGAHTDDVDDILSYDAVTEAIEAELSAERLNLLETLAERIADRILIEPQPLRVFVRIEKLDRGPGNLGVEIVRDRNASTSKTISEGSLRTQVVYLDDDALSDKRLPAFLDRLEADPRPFVLCVSSGNAGCPKVGTLSAQRHIDLLEIEQNAWQLAATDPRCVVVDTRTELDWGMKNNQISVWAPSKIVLDAVDGPAETNPLTLAIWFAAIVQAEALFVVAQDTSVGGNIPVNRLSLDDTP